MTGNVLVPSLERAPKGGASRTPEQCIAMMTHDRGSDYEPYRSGVTRPPLGDPSRVICCDCGSEALDSEIGGFSYSYCGRDALT